jgi:hypothetical protein
VIRKREGLIRRVLAFYILAGIPLYDMADVLLIEANGGLQRGWRCILSWLSGLARCFLPAKELLRYEIGLSGSVIWTHLPFGLAGAFFAIV